MRSTRGVGRGEGGHGEREIVVGFFAIGLISVEERLAQRYIYIYIYIYI